MLRKSCARGVGEAGLLPDLLQKTLRRQQPDSRQFAVFYSKRMEEERGQPAENVATIALRISAHMLCGEDAGENSGSWHL
mmetsp:Transcript_30834/g.99738  ORF Transcript_30834/g.99738 Transcript_30834/m.99738 type:complete len:80 (-) Transcript_30834:501-740(-)|eukprot:scaffold36288_cov110-Isochrysis_galbana.AAC.6